MGSPLVAAQLRHKCTISTRISTIIRRFYNFLFAEFTSSIFYEYSTLKGTVIDLATGRQVLVRKTSLIVLLVVALLEEVEVEQHQCSGEQRLVRWGRSGWKLDHEVVCGTSRHAQPPKVAAWPLVLESSHDILRHCILNENAVRRVEARRRAAVGKSVRAAIRHDEIVDRFRAVIHHGVVKLVPVERNGRERA